MKIKVKPKLRFPDFKDDWKVKKLGNVVDFYTTNSFSRALLTYDGGEVKNIHYGDIHTKFNSSFAVSEEDVPYINSGVNLEKIPEENYCQVGDLVIADASEDYKDIGKSIEIINTNNQKILAGLHTILARDSKEELALGFKGYLMQSDSVRKQMMVMATGVSVLGISKTNLAKLEMVMPNKAEQGQIANFLSALDEKIQALTKKKTLLEQYKKGVLQRLFSQDIRFKDEHGHNLPDWEERRLGDVVDFFTTNSFSRALLNYEDGNVKNIHYGDIHKRFNSSLNVADEEIPYINSNVNIEKISDENYCKIGDLLIADASEDYKDIGKSIEIISLNGQKLVAGLHTILVRSKEGVFALGFKSYLMQTEVVRKQMMTMATGVSVLGISKGNLAKLTLSLPTLLEQEKITGFLTAIDMNIVRSNQLIESAQTYKKGLLQKMFV